MQLESETFPSFREPNENIALFIEKIRAYKVLSGETNTYKLASYNNAVQAIREYPHTICSGEQAQKDIKGFGKSIHEEIDLYLSTGTSPKLTGLEQEHAESSKLINKFTSYFGISPNMVVEWEQNGFTDVETVLQFNHSLTAENVAVFTYTKDISCLLYTSPSPRDRQRSRMPSSA